MSDMDTKFQIKLWLSAVFGALIAFGIIKFVWKEASELLLLVFLLVGLLINLLLSTTRKKRDTDNRQYFSKGRS
jgi:hypothetical protein